MGILKDQTIDELSLRGLSDNTIKTYLFAMKQFTNYDGKSPGLISFQEVRKYQLKLITEKKYASSTINIKMSAIKFFYRSVLGKHWTMDYLPRFRRPKKQPIVLSKKEVESLLSVTTNIKHLAILLTIYSAGLRVSELTSLKSSNIDSSRMVINIQSTKYNKDRTAIISPVLLELLRKYWIRVYGCFQDILLVKG